MEYGIDFDDGFVAPHAEVRPFFSRRPLCSQHEKVFFARRHVP